MIEQVLHRPLGSNYRANDRRGSEVAAAHSTAFLNTGSGSTVSDGDGQSFRQQQMERLGAKECRNYTGKVGRAPDFTPPHRNHEINFL